MSVGMLMGRPAEEIPGSAGDLLSELSQLHEQVRQVMHGIARALCPSVSLPEGIGELAEKLKGARRRFRLWWRSPKGIVLKQKGPCGVINVVAAWSDSAILIWW